MKLVCLVLCSLLVCDFAYSAAGDNYICDIVKWPAVFTNKVRDYRDRDSTAIKNLKFSMKWKTDGKVVLTEITEFQDETTTHGIPVEYEVENTYWSPGFWSGSAWHTGIQQIHFDETIGRLIKVDGLYSPKHPNFMVTVLHMKCYAN